MVNASGVNIVNVEKCLYNLESIMKDPALGLRALMNNKSCKNLRSSSCSRLKIEP
jgi:hypothetical protein